MPSPAGRGRRVRAAGEGASIRGIWRRAEIPRDDAPSPADLRSASPGRREAWNAPLLALILLSLLAPRPAHANGAFPESQRIFAPADRPGELLLATNFGLISSPDDGQRWQWICEHGDVLLGSRYEQGGPRLYAAAPVGLALSDDGGCSWRHSLELEAALVSDLFAEPGNGDRLWVVARKRDVAAGEGPSLFLSTDGGATFGAPRYTVPAGAAIDGVEAARSDPRRVYLTVRRGGESRSEFVRSDDGGATWRSFTAPVIGANPVRIAAVDPADPDRVYLRVQGFPDEALGLTTDGGATITTPLIVPRGQLTAFVRRADASLLAAAVETRRRRGPAPVDRRRRPLRAPRNPLSPRALAERGGRLIAATDNVSDGFAIAASTDARAWSPLFHYSDVAAVKACPGIAEVPAICQPSCELQVARGLFSAELCSPPAEPVDAAADAPAVPAPQSGCGCRVAGRVAGQFSGPAALLMLAFAALVWRRPKR